MISIHAPHEGERLGGTPVHFSYLTFQSTLPTRGSDEMREGFKSTFDVISIHAPHEGERRFQIPVCGQRPVHISIHAPHEGERRGGGTHRNDRGYEFQSTLPTRGSDGDTGLGNAQPMRFQSTLPTRGSDVLAHGVLYDCLVISIHAPHEGERRSRRQG